MNDRFRFQSKLACLSGLILLGLPSLGFAEPTPELRLTVDSKILPAKALYLGQELALPLTAEWPPGNFPEIVGDLFLRNNGLLVPLTKANPALPAANENQSSIAKTIFKIAVPPVEKPTEFLLLFRLQDQKSPLATQSIFAFPEKPGDFLKTFLALPDAQRTLSVFGDNPPLRYFLTENQIEHRDLGPEIPEELSPAARQSVGDGKKLSGLIVTDNSAQSVALIFDSASRKPPGVFQSNLFAIVTLPLVDGLGTDPRSEKTLVETLEILLAHP